MPGYKAHLVGSTTTAVAAMAGAAWLGVYRPDLESALELGGLSILGGLFPDVDTNSKGRRLFYGAAVVIDIVLFLHQYYRLAAVLGFLALLPAIDGHRGWTHSWWAALMVPSPLFLIPVYLLHYPWPAVLPYYLAAVLGYYSHLLLDRFF